VAVACRLARAFSLVLKIGNREAKRIINIDWMGSHSSAGLRKDEQANSSAGLAGTRR